MLTSPTILRERLVTLDNDIGLLSGRRVALLGFRDSNAKRVDENLRALRATPGWTVVDIRTPPPGPLHELIAPTLSGPKLALLLDTAVALPTDATLLIRALHDSQDAVRWADGTQSQLPTRLILYVIAAGARWPEELPSRLAQIDFMDFIRPPE